MKYIIFKVCYIIFGNLLSLVPKKKNLIIFGSMNGKFYGDNSRYVFEKLHKNKKYIPVWITKSKKDYKYLKAKKFNVVNTFSIKGIYTLWSAKIGLFTNSLSDLSLHTFLVPNNIKLIALRHGRSVKRVRFARKKHKISKDEEVQRKYEGKLINFVISTSPLISKIQEECLKVGLKKSAITGYPRNDILIDKSNIKNNKFRVLYAPSWRHGRNYTKFFPFNDFNKKEFIEFIEKNNILFYLRPHKNDLLKYKELLIFLKDLEKSSHNIHLAIHNKFPDINKILSNFNILITDYSAVYHDYLLLDRPIFFIPYDYNEFKELNGFLYDYKKNICGPIIDSNKALILELNNIINNIDKYKNARLKLLDMIHRYRDNKSTDRVIKLIDKLI